MAEPTANGEHEFENGELTKRSKRAAEIGVAAALERMGPGLRTFKTIHYLIATAIALLGVGAVLASWQAGFAKNSVVQKIAAAQDHDRQVDSERFAHVELDQAVLQAVVKRIEASQTRLEADMHWHNEAEFSILHRRDPELPPPPKHLPKLDK